MNWIKRFFQLFINKENNIDDDESFDYEQLKKVNMDNRNKLDAKVSYQYPKGSFRFPLIPDDEKKLQQKTTSAVQRKNDDVRQNRVNNNYSNRAKPKSEKMPGSKIEKKRSRPFQPTNIPSPIYGFKERPLHKSEPFENTMDEIKPIVDQNKIEPMSEFRQTKTSRFDYYGNDQLVKNDKQTIHSDKLPSKQTNEQKQNSIQLEIESPREQHLNQLQSTMEQTDEQILNSEQSVIELPQEQNMDCVDSTYQQELVLDHGVHQSSEEEIKKIEEDFLFETTDEIHVKQPIENEEKTIIKPIIEADSEVGTLVNDTQIDEKSSTIPFNVIMLKQDKRKLKNMESIISPVLSVEGEKNPHKEMIDISQKNIEEEPYQSVEDIQKVENNYSFPSPHLLKPPVLAEESNQWVNEQSELLDKTLMNFNVGAHVVNITQGPSVTRFEVQPEPGVKVNKITNLSDDIKLSLAARDIRIEAPIPGKHTIGIEVPNRKGRPVFLSEVVNNQEFINQESPLTAALGLDISGRPIVTDLRKMPHGLIAGATGSGKSVCINTILVSLLYKATPQELKLLLIDPKMVELAPYNHIPHLVSPVITDVKAATAALKWAVEEMERRYELFAHSGVRDIGRFNEIAKKHRQFADQLPYIVIIIDELADLMMMSPADVEEAICRIAQKARACGIHLIIATQRPSVDVITGLIKANVPTRIAFSVSSQIDSRTIIDISGAEKLLGKGDMLFLENGTSKPVRLQGTFVSDEEIDEVVAYVKTQGEPDYLFEQEELLKKEQVTEEEDELFYEACEFVIENGGASTSVLQRRFKIGYNRAARLIDMMEKHSFISESRGSKPREVFITDEELINLLETSK